MYLDVVVNHTADVVAAHDGSSYSDIPYRDCHGKNFNPARYVTAKTVPVPEGGEHAATSRSSSRATGS